VPPDVRDQVVDFVWYWAGCTEISSGRLVSWLGIPSSKYYDWRSRYGKVNEHNNWIPRDFWLEDWEKEAIANYYLEHADQGYRRLTFMMLDENIVAVGPSSVYRVLKSGDLLSRWSPKPSLKGTGFHGPKRPHEHWHVDISYLNICGTFYYLCSLLDGYSRFVVHWEIREAMRERDVEVIIQRAREKFPEVYPRIISDRGPQFVAKDFKSYIRVCGMSHVLTSPHYPQSNGKKERWFRTLKAECIRRKTPLSLEEARRIVAELVTYYNTKRLHSAIGYIAPVDKLHGREQEIFASRDKKLEDARARRKANRQNQIFKCQRTEQRPMLSIARESANTN
jgi:putative transposase